jgi:phycocyanobilin:ferredoxin oxidoreductase
MYPRPQFDVPILGLDVVIARGKVAFAIVDTSPVTTHPLLELPLEYENMVDRLQIRHNIRPTLTHDLPPWGRKIFSQKCVVKHRPDDQEVLRLGKYITELIEKHIDYSKSVSPAGDHWRIRAAHKNYCENQLLNDKTAGMLAGAFGNDVAKDYMQTVMFDCHDW